MPQPLQNPTDRLLSIDTFRGAVIFIMLFVNMVAMLGDLPIVGEWMGSAPVSIFRHASCSYDPPVWLADVDNDAEKCFWRGGKIVSINDNQCEIAIQPLTDSESVSTEVLPLAKLETPKPLRDGTPVIVKRNPATHELLRVQAKDNGCTICDWVAPFFVFIVGVCIPLSRKYRREQWLGHVGKRTLALLGLGFLDMSLGAGLSYWWGILQSIAIAYCVAALVVSFSGKTRFFLVLILGAIHLFMTQEFSWWTFVGNPDVPPFSINTLDGDLLRPLNAHCTPWAGLGYVLVAIIGTLVGDSFGTRDIHIILKRTLLATACPFIIMGTLLMFLQPMSKEEVTTSYAFFTAGVAAAILALFYLTIDVWKHKYWTRLFTVFGVNPLLAFILQPFLRMTFEKLGLLQLYHNHAGPEAIAWGLAWVMTVWIIVLFCNKKGWYWKV
ncbi:hypothetical protein GX645_05370 [Candidatus Sumerlaeota bacterium]|nr:hypothetical protein [Candidatus Sumerlaeota bacterium]